VTPLEWHAEARIEFLEAQDYYEDQRPGLGDEFAAAVDVAVEKARTSPETWAHISAEARCVRTHRFPYAIVYQFENGRVFVLAVSHSRREPGYWLDRAT
jgi:plasmid stabilization system protein ParE